MIKPFQSYSFLGRFELSRDHIHFPDRVFFDIDNSIRNHIVFDNKDLESYLIAQTEFLSTFSTAKAEETNALPANEAKRILRNFLGFDKNDVKMDGGADRDKFDAQEFKDIVRGFRLVCEKGLGAEDLSLPTLKNLHFVLTEDLDRLGRYIGGQEPDFNSGDFRKDDAVWIGGLYAPAKYEVIEEELSAAIQYYQDNQSIADCFVFSLAAYAIHPFSNGNKRVCRIMEHALLRSLGINQANMYSHIVETYHNLDRYKEAIKASLGRKILNNLVNMQLESLFWAQLHTLRAAVEFDRQKLVDEFLKAHSRKYLIELLGSLVTTKALQYKSIKMDTLPGISDQVLTTLLKWCRARKILRSYARGNAVFYELALDSKIERDLVRFYAENKRRISYTPDNFHTSLLQNAR